MSTEQFMLTGVGLPTTLSRRRSAYPTLKRLFDVALALIALPFILPLCLFIAVLIYIDSPGPILFVQKRTGKFGRRFNMYKFRTMVPNAEEMKLELLHLNELTWPDFKITNDPRITRIGRILRKTSLDELPQIINILKGDMSWVGPRPTSFGPETYKPWQMERLKVEPGLTGLWQVSGRSNIDFDERVRLDIRYIRERSFWLDIKIMFRTVTAVLQAKGAC